MQKILPPILYLIALAIIFASYFSFATDSTPLLLMFVGVLLAIAGLAITVFHNQLFKKEQTNIYTFARPDKLVKKGFFRYTRNPMYLGFSISLLGWAIAYSSVISWLAVAAFVLISDRWYIPFEEQAMREVFGEEYLQYCAETGRWFTMPFQSSTD